FTDTVAGIFNDYAVTAPMEMFLTAKFDRHPTEIARLRGARLVVAHETTKGRAWDEAKVKTLTGGDPLSARFMRGDFFDFSRTHKLRIAGNTKPSLRNVDEAIRRRWKRIGLKVPEGIRKATEDYLADQDALGQWIADCVETNPDAFTLTRKLFK